MNKYELNMILAAGLSDEVMADTLKKYTDVIESNKGIVKSVVKTGVKRLAYAINFKRDGFYLTVEFEGNANIPAELTRLFNIDENVYRYLFLNKN